MTTRTQPFTTIARIALIMIVIVSFFAWQQNVLAQAGPPPHAITACTNQTAEDSCQITTPRGDTINGTCQMMHTVLACVPAGLPSSIETPPSVNTPPSVSTSPSVQTSSYTVVDTGQTTCYENHLAITCPAAGASWYGQDAQHIGNQPSYTNNGDGTITDNTTGLMWQQGYSGKMTYDEALSGASSVNLAGYTDWRLPTIKELYSLIDFSGTDPSGYPGNDTSGLIPFIDTDYFTFAYGDTSVGERIIDAQYASSTLYVSTEANGGRTMFGVNLADGRIKGYGLSMRGGDKTFYVKYVRGNTAYGINSFVDNGNGTITDQATGFMWSQTDSGTGMNWQEALAWVAQKNAESYLGYNDWRLPNAKELQSIVDYTRAPDTSNSPALDPLFSATAITNEAGKTDYPYYWTSTTHVTSNGMGGSAAYLSFGRALGYMFNQWLDVHGAGAQRSDPKSGDPADYPTGHGPQGDAIRIYNYVRLVRDAGTTNPTDTATATTPATGTTTAMATATGTTATITTTTPPTTMPPTQSSPTVVASATTTTSPTTTPLGEIYLPLIIRKAG